MRLEKRRTDVVFAIYIYIYPLYIHGAFSATYSASSVKIWHPPRAGREKGSERGRGRGN
jgi:hypothetical protein